MRQLILPALALVALSGCGPKAKNEAAEANETLAGDSNTMGEAVADVNAATAAMSNDAAILEGDNSSVPADEGEGDGNEITD